MLDNLPESSVAKNLSPEDLQVLQLLQQDATEHDKVCGAYLKNPIDGYNYIIVYGDGRFLLERKKIFTGYPEQEKPLYNKEQ